MNPQPHLPAPFTWTPEMGEISGFGGGYEEACQKMTRAGVAWLEAEPRRLDTLTRLDAPEEERNTVYRALQDCVEAAEEGSSGAMTSAAAKHALRIAADGWPAYVTKMVERTAKARAEAPARDARRKYEQEVRRLQRRQDDEAIEAWARADAPTLAQAAAFNWRGLFFFDGVPRAALGSHVNDACADFCRLARVLKQPFSFEFNGVSLVATPETETEELVFTFLRGLQQ